jgi:ATP-dependent DNA helicase RecQ
LSAEFIKILKKYWGYDSFRPLQLEIIESIYNNIDTLALMPTGGGKSITFQVPALAKEGCCLVITPLIALMKDQVENLRERGICAEALYSGMSFKDQEQAINNIIYGGGKFLYISPERLLTRNFMSYLDYINISMLAVDEAHCISQWGYDFRPSYLRIIELREKFPKVPILALTATATPSVVKDIQKKLGFSKKNVFKKSFERKNLIYRVRFSENKDADLLSLVNCCKGSMIVYVRSRRRCVEISNYLTIKGIKSTYYHAGLSPQKREEAQALWMSNKVRLVVATNAFGMGIDKPDVRLVIHLDIPDNIESYFQEAGRAGRDEKKSFAVLIYNNTDIKNLKKRISDNYPPKDLIRKCYESVCNYFQLAVGTGEGQIFPFDLIDFCDKFKFNAIQAYSSLKILQSCGYIELTDELNNSSKLTFTMDRDDLYRFRIQNQEVNDIILFLLRNYTGIFTTYSRINEKEIARKLNITPKEVYDILVDLSKRKIVSYIPRKKTPYLIFTTVRHPKSYLKIKKEVYSKRKELFKRKIDYIISYATSEHECRSIFLIKYFGQKDIKKCGECDVCRLKNKGLDESSLLYLKLEKDKIQYNSFGEIGEKKDKC